jgi:ATP-dependent Clp protease ATP-binding subunit ClpC
MGRRTTTSGRPRWAQLERYGEDLTARLGHEPEPLVDRPEVTRALSAALARWEGASVALVGRAGAGASCAVRALTQSLAGGGGPSVLAGRQVYRIDARRLVAGTRFRGELEDRIARLEREVVAGRGRLVLVLDRADLVVGSNCGAAAGAALASLLSSGGWVLPLVPGQLTTLADVVPGWEGLVQVVPVPEWADGAAEAAARGWLRRISAHHDVRYDDDAPDLAVRLARRYLTAPALPGAAVDLLDQAGALARVDGRSVAGRPHGAPTTPSAARGRSDVSSSARSSTRSPGSCSPAETPR